MAPQEAPALAASPAVALETVTEAPHGVIPPDAALSDPLLTHAVEPAASISLADTTLPEEPSPALAEPSAEPSIVKQAASAAEVDAPPTATVADEPLAGGELSSPRRVRVRVRRKRLAPVDTAPVDITRVDTDILPQISLVAPRESEPQMLPENAPAPVVSVVSGVPVAELALEAAPAQVEPAAEEPAAEEPAAEEPTAPLYAAALLAPEVAEPRVSPVEAPTVAPLEEDVVTTPASEAAPEPDRNTPVRRMPTLAVMASLRQRPEPVVAPTSPAEETDVTAPLAEPSAAPAMRAAPLTAPLSPADRLDGAALDDIEAPTPERPSAAEPSIAEPPTAPEPSSAQAPLVAEAPAQSRPTPAEDAPTESSGHQMWWPQAARRRAAPETRPVASLGQRISDDDLEITAPRPASPRVAPVAPMTPAPVATPAAREAREQRADEADDADEAYVRRVRAAERRRGGARRTSPRAAVLSWAAFGHAAVASVAALLAVIALLRSSAGPDALEVFGWALALTLIAGVGAAVGYFCAQRGYPRLATLMLLLSQLGALAWALALLGPRSALLALAPASVALALRGSGRISAVVAALAWMTLFIVDEALTLSGALATTLPLSGIAAALVDVLLPLVGLWLAVSILISLYSSRMRAVSHGRAVEHVALLTEAQLHRLRTQSEDDAEALRRALAEALRGEQPERVYAHGALSVVADTVNELADRLIDLRYDRAERKRLESATRRLTRVIERAWLGLSWSWPDATGTILDDLLALLRTPPPPDTPDLMDVTAPTGQVVSPHLFRGWLPTEPNPLAPRPPAATQPGMPSAPSAPSQPSLPSLWPSDPGVRLTDPLELPPSPRWRSPDAIYDASDRPGALEP